MALILADRVKESTTTTGTSDFALGGAITGFQSFATAVGANNTTYYAIADGADWEVGLGTLSSDGLTLVRTTVYQSSNSDTKVSFAAGAKHIFVTYAADKAVFEDASGNVTLPANLTVTGGSTTDSVQLDLTAGVTPAVGQIAWDAAQGTATLGLLGGNVLSRLGQTLVAYVTNAESTTITKGQAVYLFGAQGDRATVKLANNTGDATSAKTLGIVAEDITANGTGFVVCQGVVNGLNLAAYTAGDTLYLGATAGALTATKPYAPNHLVYIGVVEKANSGAGQLYVRVQNGYELDELHNVSAQSPSNGQTIVYNSSNSLWENNTVSLSIGVNGTLPIANGGTGQTTANAAFNALAPSQTGNSGKYLTTDGSNTSWASNPLGTVTSVAATVPSFLSISGSPITTSGTLAFGLSGTALPTTSGGTGLTSFTANGVVYASSTSALATGSALTFDGTTLVTPYGGLQLGTLAYFTGGGTSNLLAGTNAAYGFELRTNSATRYQINSDGTSIWTIGSEQMRLTSTGLGIGTTSPNLVGFAKAITVNGSTSAGYEVTVAGTNIGYFGGDGSQLYVRTSGANPLTFGTNGTERARIDSSGNLGLGVTPSAWNSTYRGFELGKTGNGLYGWSGGGLVGLIGGAYIDSAYNFKYALTGQAIGKYEITETGKHVWALAPSGTAGTTASFTPAMTLDASGNLIIGSTTSLGKLSVWSAANGDVLAGFRCAGTGTQRALYISGDNSTGIVSLDVTGSASGSLAIKTGGTTTALFDTSGNLGLGVTPSAWFANSKVLQIGNAGALEARNNSALVAFSSNQYIDTSGNYKYIATDYATRYYQITGQHIWQTAASGTAGNAISFTQAMTLDASGNLGIGTTSPSSFGKFAVTGSLGTFAVESTGAVIKMTRASTNYITATSGDLSYCAGIHAFTNSAVTTEYARIDSSGNLLVGKTSTAVSLLGVAWLPTGNGFLTTSDSGTQYPIGFYREGNSSAVGFISTTSSATTYATSSDYRLKNTIAPMTGALAKVALLKPCTYKWNADGSDGEGFIAHELAEVVPQCVTGEKDAVDADGNPKYQGIDTSFLVATLTAAIQELKAEFDAYKASHP